MKSLTKSMLRLSLATCYAGARSCVSFASVGAAGGRRSAKEMAAMLQLAYHAGEGLQEECVDLAWGALQPEGWGRTLRALVGSCGDTARFSSPTPDGGLARRELRNKLEVFRWVLGVGESLDLPAPGEPFLLSTALVLAGQLDPRQRLWAIEGLGHRYVEGELLRSAARGLGKDIFGSQGIADSVLPMLHAGMGLAVAKHVLQALPRTPSESVVHTALSRFFRLSREGATPGSEDLVREGLGLVARCFFPGRIPVLAEHLKSFEGGRWSGLFWHGVGRGLYFAPRNLLPGIGLAEHVLGMARRETRELGAGPELLAGVGYALALVNLSHPGVLAALLWRQGVGILAEPFGDGLRAALVMRYRVTGEDSDLAGFLEYRPREAELAQGWIQAIRQAIPRDLGEPPLSELYGALGQGAVGRSSLDPASGGIR